jgi:NAD(P)-dependent dehydrogenase (short-subunit alcohol dehydrogenase family)
MQLSGKVVVVTGGGNGIGRALCRRFAAEGAKAIVVADVNAAAAAAVASEIGGTAITADVSREADVVRLVTRTMAEHGAIDLFCSNAGIVAPANEQSPDREWERTIAVNVMAHVYAARTLVPRMVERGGGYLLNTASAAGLLTQIGSATYSVTKHAAFAFAEWLAITYGERGITVSVLAPQAVDTAMTAGVPGGGVAGVDGMLQPEQVADVVIAGLDAEQFLILPHPEVLEYFRRKGSDYDRWIRGMQRLQGRFGDTF